MYNTHLNTISNLQNIIVSLKSNERTRTRVRVFENFQFVFIASDSRIYV